MKITLRPAVTALATLTLFFTGCSGGDSHEKLAEDAGKQMDRMATALSSITDKASAEKAMTDMKSVVEDFKKLGTRAKALGQPSADVKAKTDAKMKAKQDEMQQKMMASQANMAKAGPEALGIIMKGMQELAPAMAEVGKIFEAADK